MWKDKTTSYPPVAIFPPFCNPRGWHKTTAFAENNKTLLPPLFPSILPTNSEGEGKRLCSSGPFWVFRLISARDCVSLWGLLLRNDDGVVEYINGRVDELTEVDADYVNLKDLESVFKDSDINAMCAAALANGNRIHIYFDHCIAVPDIISPAEEDDGMFSPPGVDDDAEDDEAEDDEAEDDEEQCRPKKKKTARQSNDDSKEDITEEEEGARRGNDDSKEDVSEEESLVHEEGANEEEANDSFDENGYEYDSEELKTPRSSDDEEHDSETLAQFNEKAEFGHVYLELGMESVKDYNISLGRQFVWLKNDKQRARARCSVKECEWVIYCGWNNKCHTWQIKTFNDKHTFAGCSITIWPLEIGLPRN
ncbi:hypothetical protein K1719_004572 [Acacia pycnantha]|nr:hypothetical protein K1719_004572 [Acacia pycnantha]